MKKGNHNGKISVHAISGNHVVMLGFDATDTAMTGLLGFAIKRTDIEEDESYWLNGYKPFKEIHNVPVPGTFYSTLESPIQSFIWGDYSVKPGKTYTYSIVPVYGKPKNLTHGEAVDVKIKVEPLEDAEHEIYFNRGVAASQAYALKFGNSRPDQLPERKKEIYQWLSRGLFEAIIKFIQQAKDQTFKIKAALYELDYPEVMDELKLAQQRGADVQIIYHAKKDKQATDNITALFNAGFTDNDQETTFERKKSGGIFHNKFFILIKNNTPIQVFTGSTNISEGGIFGHSNVGHCLKNEVVADKYLQYWNALKSDPSKSTLATLVESLQPNIDGAQIPQGISVSFSPRVDDTMLNEYIKAFATAKELANITLPFNMDKRLIEELERETDLIRYITLNQDKANDKKEKGTDIIIEPGMDYVQHFRSDKDVLISPGGYIEEAWGQWLKEALTGFNGSVVRFIHTKYLLIDPLSKDPIVITGSANFSKASIDSNDENMLIIRGNTRVADIYLGEFFRIFDHLYFRYIVMKFSTNAEGGFLKSNSKEWLKPYQTEGHAKFKRRKIFSFGFN